MVDSSPSIGMRVAGSAKGDHMGMSPLFGEETTVGVGCWCIIRVKFGSGLLAGAGRIAFHSRALGVVDTGLALALVAVLAVLGLALTLLLPLEVGELGGEELSTEIEVALLVSTKSGCFKRICILSAPSEP